MFDMSESLSLWMTKLSVVAAAAGGVTVPGRGDVGAVDGSGLVSLRLRCSGGERCGPACDGVGDGDVGDAGCRNRVGTWRGDARWMSGG